MGASLNLFLCGTVSEYFSPTSGAYINASSVRKVLSGNVWRMFIVKPFISTCLYFWDKVFFIIIIDTNSQDFLDVLLCIILIVIFWTVVLIFIVKT